MKRFNPLKPAPPSAMPMAEQRKAPQPPGATEFPVTLSENHRKDGLELRFPRRPSDDVLDSLKAAGWRWSRFNQCWYHRNTPEHRTFANRFLKAEGVPVPVASTPAAPEVPVPAPVSSPSIEEPKTDVPSNILPVQFTPDTTFPVTPKPVPAWQRALMGRPVTP